jgi:hypothetical protein
MRWSGLWVALAGFIAVPTTGEGQSRGSVWAQFAAGRGDLSVHCNICRGDAQRSGMAELSMGGWVDARTALGGELAYWRLGADEATQRALFIGATGQRYPMRVPAFFKLGAGLLIFSSADDERTLGARSLALQGGLGYDVPAGGRYVVVPQVTLLQAFNRGLSLDDARVTGWSRVTLVRLGLGVGVNR